MAWLGALDRGDLSKELEYRFISGAEHVTRMDLLFRHVVNHSTYHRGQIAHLLRVLGVVPPSTDWVVWDYQRRGE